MASSGGPSLENGPSPSLQTQPKPFKLDSTSLLQSKMNTQRYSLSKSPMSTDSESDRVSYLRGALGEKNGGDQKLPQDTGLKIDRTQSLVTPTGYSSSAGSSYRPLSREYNLTDRTRSVPLSETSVSASTPNNIKKQSPKTNLTPTALTRNSSLERKSLRSSKTISENNSSIQQRSLRGSQSSLVRAGSATPTGDLSESSIDFQKETRSSKVPTVKPPKKPSSSSDSSDDGEEHDAGKKIGTRAPFSYTGGKPLTTSHLSTSSSRTPTPKVVLEDHSPPSRSHLIKSRVEPKQNDADQSGIIKSLKTALDLAQQKNQDDKDTIYELKKHLQAIIEEKNREDPVLKAALEDALREIRENKDVIMKLNKELNELNAKNESMKEELSSMQRSLQENENYRSQDVTTYRTRVVALEEENMLLKREKDDLSTRLTAVSSKLDSQDSGVLKDKEQLEASLRIMQEKVLDTHKDKLYAAIKTDDFDAIDNLLLSVTDINAVITPDDSGRRAIHLLAENIKYEDYIKQLIESKANLNVLDNDGETALHIAARSGRGRVVRALLEAGADWRLVNVEGWSPMQVAAAVGNVSALEEFRKNDPRSLKVEDKEGSTLLHYACANSQKRTTQWLVRHRAGEKRKKDTFGLLAKDYREAAKSDDSLMACFGSGGKALAQEQLPRLQLESQGSIRRSRSSLRSSSRSKAMSDTDQGSHTTASEKHFMDPMESDTDVGQNHQPTEDESDARSSRMTPVPSNDRKPNVPLHTKESLQSKMSICSESGRSTVSVNTTQTSASVHRPPRTPPPSAMPGVNIPHDDSFSEGQVSDISIISSQRSFKERLPTGLPNLGNTCYMNAILQCLYYTKPLSDSFISTRYRGNINKGSEYNGEAALAFGDMVKALRTGKQTYAAVKDMKEMSGKCDSYYLDDDTKDPYYYLQHFLHWLHKDLSKDISPNEHLSQGPISLISTLFFGVHMVSIVCQESGVELGRSEESFSVLSLPVEISGPTELQELLTNSYKPQLILWSCAECGKDHMCLKKRKILRMPSTLIIHFDRNEEINGNLLESKNKMSYPHENLSLSDYLEELNSDRGTYELYAICNKKGHGITSHHTACCMTANSPIWCLFNDLTVNPVTKNEVASQTDAHLLFYKKTVVPYQSTGV